MAALRAGCRAGWIACWIDWPTERIDLIGRMQGPVGLPVLMRWTNGVEAGRGLGSETLRGGI